MTITPRIACALLACASLAGCITEGPAPVEPTKPKPMPREVTNPVKLSVSPLTRIGRESIAGPSLFVHLEFQNDQGQSVKAYGLVRVELFEPASNPDAKTQPVAQVWDVDLSDSLKNALMFDEMITRTYTLALSKIPPWLEDWASRKPDAPATAPSIIVQFKPRDSSDSSQVLRVAYTLTR
jgi:hypothetical protein